MDSTLQYLFTCLENLLSVLENESKLNISMDVSLPEQDEYLIISFFDQHITSLQKLSLIAWLNSQKPLHEFQAFSAKSLQNTSGLLVQYVLHTKILSLDPFFCLLWIWRHPLFCVFSRTDMKPAL